MSRNRLKQRLDTAGAKFSWLPVEVRLGLFLVYFVIAMLAIHLIVGVLEVRGRVSEVIGAC